MNLNLTRGPYSGAVARLLPQGVVKLDPSAAAASNASGAAPAAREDDGLGDLVEVGVVGDEVLEGGGLQRVPMRCDSVYPLQ